MMSLPILFLPASNCTVMETNVPLAIFSTAHVHCVGQSGPGDLWSFQESVIAVAKNIAFPNPHPARKRDN